jgi:MFS transporter, DHA1 family, tetracycline resistance protein
MTLQHPNARSQLATLLLIVFLGFLGVSMPYLIFPTIFLNPAYSILPADWSTTSRALLLGVTLAAYPFGQFIGSPILGALSDDYGRKKLLSGSLLVAAFSNLLTGFALEWHLLWLVILSRFIAGLMEGNIAIARAMAVQLKSISKHEAFGKINAAASIAYLVGPLFGGLLADSQLLEGETSATPFYTICALFFGISILSMFVLQKDHVIKHVSEREATQHILERFKIIKRLSKLFKNRRLRFLMLISTFFTLAIDIFYEFGPVYLTDKWMLGPMQLSVYNSLLCIALAIGNGWLATFCSTRYSNRNGIIAATGGFTLFLLGTVLTNQVPLMLTLFTVIGLAIGLGVTLLTVKISDSAPDAIQGEVMGVQLSLRVLGDAVICLLGGLFLLISSKLILVLAAIISASTMVYYGTQEAKFKIA